MSNLRAKSWGMRLWDPFDIAGALCVEDAIELPDGIAGLTYGQKIWLNPTLTPIGKRCTLAHELIHVERGVIEGLSPDLLEREENTVDRIAAHRLVPTQHLVDAIVWTQGTGHLGEIAEEIDLDLTFAHVRLRTVTREERDCINEALEQLVQIP